VTNGLFAFWPITEWTADKFGADSPLNVQCTNEQWFNGTQADTCPECCGKDTSTCKCKSAAPTWLRAHEDCTPYVARQPSSQPAYSGTRQLQGTQADFDACANPDYIKEWMDWQNCIEMEELSCIIMAGANTSALECNMSGFYYDENGNVQSSHVLHSEAHMRLGRDMLDVTTSPNDAGPFLGYHANLDRNNMAWMASSYDSLADDLWFFPSSQAPPNRKFNPRLTYMSGPFGAYDNIMCGLKDPEWFDEFQIGKYFWNEGTLLDDTVNAGFPFTDIFDEPPANGVGYTHREILQYTSPDVTPYTYDTLEQYFSQK